MTPGGPGDRGPYRDPYGEDPLGDPLGRDPLGTDSLGRDGYGRSDDTGNAYGQDPYGAGGGYGEGTYGGSHPGGGHGQPAWDPDPYAYPYEQQPRSGDYQAAVDALSDPLRDPLPSSGTPDAGQGHGHREETVSPWFRPSREPGGGHGTEQEAAGQQRLPQQSRQPQQVQPEPYRAKPYEPPPSPPQYDRQPQHQEPRHQEPQHQSPQSWREQQAPRPAARRRPADAGETVALPSLESVDADSASDDDTASAAPRAAGGGDDERGTVALRRPSQEELGGRAARRRAAARKGRGGGRRAAVAAPVTPPRAMTRLEARRAARAAKDGPVVLLSRAIGEVFITCGVLMLLFVAYQLWWTNILANNYAGGAKDSLTQKWEENPERKPGAFSPGQGFAIMYIPKLDVVVPVAQGIDKQSVLDNGMVGHYDEKSGLPTAMPWEKKGNFGVAGHRNTHGEPFRYINRLVAGDKIVVETADTYYVYEMYSRLPSTSPSNVSVLEGVPPQSGFEKSGRYVTLTTCTPEFTSKYRLIVWGRMVDERPRSEGKPDALVE